MAMKTFCFANQKGGVGKTTEARNFVFDALEKGQRVLATDLDPQKNFTKTILGMFAQHFGEDAKEPESLTADSLFIDPHSKNKADKSKLGLKPLDCGNNLSLIKATRDLVDVPELPLDAIHNPRRNLATIADQYDVHVIDTAPTLGKTLYAALIASDFVICPCTMDQDAIDGLEELYGDIARVQQLGWNKDLRTLGVLANRVNTRRAYDMSALADLREALGDGVFTAVLYDRAATSVAKDRPVWRVQSGESQILAAKEMRATCAEIFARAGMKV